LLSGTKVQILTPEDLQAREHLRDATHAAQQVLRLLALRVQKDNH
jgi:hypothetical protein